MKKSKLDAEYSKRQLTRILSIVLICGSLLILFLGIRGQIALQKRPASTTMELLRMLNEKSEGVTRIKSSQFYEDYSTPLIVLGMLLLATGLIILLKSKPLTKICPYCAERIKVIAKVCRYCGRELPAEDNDAP